MKFINYSTYSHSMPFETFVILALVLDWFIGDPRWFPHPVRLIGKLCEVLEQTFRKVILSPKIAGYFTTLAVIFITTFLIFAVLSLAGAYSVLFQTILAVILIYFFIAIKDLLKHSRAVYDCLEPHPDIEKARSVLSRIVGRDTTRMDSSSICRACVETLAENLVDGITAPLFWAIVFSLLAPVTFCSAICMAAIGISLYKTINTMDSMFGYKNKQYAEFGRMPARLDDLVNFIPSRLTGFAIVVVAMLSGMNWRNSLTILLRDRLNHPSPNAGHPEAAVAGALNLQLGGTSVYFGKSVAKPKIGDDIQKIHPGHILRTHKLIIFTTIFFLITLLLIRKIVLVSIA